MPTGRSDLKSSSCQAISYETQDGLYDLAWSEVHENQLVTASGDGSIKLWDVMLNVSLTLIVRQSAVESKSTSDLDSPHPGLA
jgi:peroxin-7